MYNAIRDWIIANFGLSALIFLAIIALAIYVGGWIMKFKKDIKNLPCSEHDDILKDHREQFQKSVELMAQLKASVDALPIAEHTDSLKKHDELMARIESKLENLPVSQHEDTLKKHDELMARIDAKIDAFPITQHSDSLRKHDDLMARIESKLDALPCTSHSQRQDKHDERMNKTEALLHKMEGQLEILVTNSLAKGTDKILVKSGDMFSAKHSPRVLNENGISLLNDCGGKEFLNQHMDTFISKIEKLQPKTALDVETLAIAVLQAATIDDIFNPLKDWVYNAPTRKIKKTDGSTECMDVSLHDVIFVLSLPIRDKYLEKHHM